MSPQLEVTGGEVPAPLPAERSAAGGTGRAPLPTPLTRPAQPARLPSYRGLPPPATRGGTLAPGKTVALPGASGGRAGCAALPAGHEAPASLHSPRRPARRTRWLLPPALGSSPGRAGQRLPPGPAGWLAARRRCRGAPPAAGRVGLPLSERSSLPHRWHPSTPRAFAGEAAGGPSCGRAERGRGAQRGGVERSSSPRSLRPRFPPAPVTPRPASGRALPRENPGCQGGGGSGATCAGARRDRAPRPAGPHAAGCSRGGRGDSRAEG